MTNLFVSFRVAKKLAWDFFSLPVGTQLRLFEQRMKLQRLKKRGHF